jgi:hypothetical protein
MPHYTFVTKDGDSLGCAELTGQNWRQGDTIYRSSLEPNLRVVDVLPSADTQRYAIPIVEQAPR